MSIFDSLGNVLSNVGNTIENGAEQAGSAIEGTVVKEANSVASSAETFGSAVADGNVQVAAEAGGELLLDGAEAAAVAG